MPQSSRGMSTSLLLACFASGNGFAQYMRGASAKQRSGLCTRALSTDAVEGWFAHFNTSLAGQKPTPQLAEQRMRRIDISTDIKHDPSKQFYVPHSRRQRYSGHALQADQSWNNGSLFTASHTLTNRERKVQHVANKLAAGKDFAIRDRFKK